MKFLSLLVLFGLLALQSCLAADKEAEADGIKVKVLGQSGKVRIRKGSQDESDAVEILMDELSEYASDGTTKVGQSGNSKHSFNTFASQEFVFTAVQDKDYKNISAKTFDFKSNINGAELTVTVTIFKEAGTIVNDDEEIEVKKGMVKTDISIGNWTFCNPCKSGNKNESGTKLQFTMTIKGKRSSPKMKPAKNATKAGRKSAPSYDLGENVTLILSKKYKDNALWKDMETGYPKMVTVGSKKSFLFRFEKFNGVVFYDPSVDFSESTAGGDSSAGVIMKVSLLWVVIILFINLIHSIF